MLSENYEKWQKTKQSKWKDHMIYRVLAMK